MNEKSKQGMKNTGVLVSVIIPTYSRNNTLEKAIDSVLAQTYKNIEIIVVDDNLPGSQFRADTNHIMKKYVDQYEVQYIQNTENLGGAGARNVGIEASRGEYLAFLDDDDEYYPQKIEKQLRVFLESENDLLALVFCDSVMTHDNDKFVCYVKPRYKGCCIYEAMRDNCLAATSQWLVRKDIICGIGGFDLVPSKQDSQLILKLLASGFEVKGVPEVLSKYCNYQGVRISGRGVKNLQGELLYREACRKQYYRLTFKEIIEVEYSFSERLYSIYHAMSQTEKWREELDTMKRVHRLKAYKYLLREFYYKIRG